MCSLIWHLHDVCAIHIRRNSVQDCSPELTIKNGREEERVTLVVAVATAESPTCTIYRASCYMPAHMASLSKRHAKQTFSYYQYSIFSTGGRFCLFHETLVTRLRMCTTLEKRTYLMLTTSQAFLYGSVFVLYLYGYAPGGRVKILILILKMASFATDSSHRVL